jgi:hypothetical protein
MGCWEAAHVIRHIKSCFIIGDAFAQIVKSDGKRRHENKKHLTELSYSFSMCGLTLLETESKFVKYLESYPPSPKFQVPSHDTLSG